MSELDKKLEDLIDNSVDLDGNIDFEGVVPAIKQIFTEEGWMNARAYETKDIKGRSVPFEILANALGLMTAQEWEQQAIENYNNYAAAKKAAGIEHGCRSHYDAVDYTKNAKKALGLK